MNDIWCEYCKKYFKIGWHSCVRHGGSGTEYPRQVPDFHDGYKSGFNDALEQVAKWMDELEIDRISGYEAIEQVAAHVRNMKKP